MSEFSSTPLITFKTLKNTELGATAVAVADDGSVIFCDVIKKITESMLTSYPRNLLGKWTPNRAAIRYDRDEAARRGVKNFATGEELDLDGILALVD